MVFPKLQRLQKTPKTLIHKLELLIILYSQIFIIEFRDIFIGGNYDENN